MKSVKIEDAVGQILCHDMTQIIPGVFKGAKFKKGHILKEEDISVLRSMGKDHIFIYEYDENKYHEDEAAEVLSSICKGENITVSSPSEGKVDLFASVDGLLKVDSDLLYKINSMPEIMIATKLNDKPVKKNDKIAGTRVIPLVIDKKNVDLAVETAKDKKILNILPYKNLKAGIITTGSEVYYGRIKDSFTDKVRDKIKKFNMTEIGQRYCTDDTDFISESIKELLSLGSDIIFCCGGMSVDPDDKTPGAINSVCDTMVTYGAPVLPGAMFALGYVKDIPVCGLPGCVMFSPKTIFDIVLPRLAAGEKIKKEDICALGHGGLI